MPKLKNPLPKLKIFLPKTKLQKALSFTFALIATTVLALSFSPTFSEAIVVGEQTNLNYGDRDASDPDTMPVSFTFKPGTRGYAQYKDKVFYQNIYIRDGMRFVVYTQNNPSINPDMTNFDFSSIVENWRTDMGEPSMFALADPYRNYNLKKGSSPINTHIYDGDETGGMKVQWNGVWHNWEWRYMGYTYDGTPVSNPFFPPDYPIPNVPPAWERDWTKNPAPYKAFGTPSPYADVLLNPQLPDWWNNIAFKQYPEFKTKGDWNYWNDRMTFQTNPVLGNGVLLGYTGDPKGSWRYATWTLASPAVNNLRMIKLQVWDYDPVDPSKNKLLAEFTRSADPNDIPGTVTRTIMPGASIKKGETYRITASIKNMNPPNHTTVATPIALDYKFSYDENAKKYYTFDEEYLVENGEGVMSYDKMEKLSPEEVANFQWFKEVPYDVSEEMAFVANIPFQFFWTGDDVDSNDNDAKLILPVNPEDMAIDGNIQVFDMGTGEEATFVKSHTPYKIRFFVRKVVGETPVGDPSDPNNPFAKIVSTMTDFGSFNTTKYATATETLLPNGMIQVDIDNVSTPSTVLRVCGTIDPIHKQKGQNDVSTNDGPVCRTFSSEMNLAVKDFKVSPQSIVIPKSQGVGSKTLSFNFVLLNTNQESASRPTRVVLSSGGLIIRDTIVDIPEGIPLQQTWIIDTPLSLGDMSFKVEVNPVPRTWVEYKKDGSNPYADNIATTSIHVEQNDIARAVCDAVNTRNTWTQTYDVYEWYGEWIEKTCTRSRCIERDDDGHCIDREEYEYDCSYCNKYDESNYTEDVHHYEDFRITHVLFKSKLTTDTQGGWVNILNQPGKIKAGYGFDLKIQTIYDTNRYRNAPHPFGGCSHGKTVSPGWSSVDSPEIISLTMPYKDAAGKPVVYNLVGESTGDWDEKITNFKLPERSAFGIKTTEQIYINETAKDGIYTVRIDTVKWPGTPDKPYSADLCDRINAQIQIIGSNIDDVNSHLTQ